MLPNNRVNQITVNEIVVSPHDLVSTQAGDAAGWCQMPLQPTKRVPNKRMQCSNRVQYNHRVKAITIFIK